MAQEIVRDEIQHGVPGLLYGDENTVLSRVNKNGQAKQIEKVTVDTASDDTDYTITINGVDVTYTSGSGATKESIRDGLIQAVKDEPLVTGHVDPETDTTDSFTLTAVYPGQGFDFSESDANLSSSQTQANAEASDLPFGRAVMPDGLDLGEQAAKIAKAANLTARSVTLGLTDASGDTYIVYVEIEGQTYRGEFTSSGGGAATLAQALRDDLNGSLPSETVDASENSGDLVLDAELAGKDFSVSFDVEGGNGGAISVSSDNESRLTDIEDALVGISCVKTMSAYPRDGKDGAAKIGPNDPFDALGDGMVLVETEDQVDEADGVWVRLSANGNLDQLGGFRASDDTGCVKLEGASWVGRFADDLAVVEL